MYVDNDKQHSQCTLTYKPADDAVISSTSPFATTLAPQPPSPLYLCILPLLSLVSNTQLKLCIFFDAKQPNQLFPIFVGIIHSKSTVSNSCDRVVWWSRSGGTTRSAPPRLRPPGFKEDAKNAGKIRHVTFFGDQSGLRRVLDPQDWAGKQGAPHSQDKTIGH